MGVDLTTLDQHKSDATVTTCSLTKYNNHQPNVAKIHLFVYFAGSIIFKETFVFRTQNIRPMLHQRKASNELANFVALSLEILVINS